MKKILVVSFFVIAIIFCNFSVSTVNETATLYNYYADNMLFKQNDEAILGGKALPGTVITCALHNSQNELVAYTETVASSDKTFSLSFPAPEGSFDEYSITLTANGIIFSKLKGIVFGELWLAGGQSNMQWPLQASKNGAQMMAENKKGSDALRFLDIPHPGNYKGSSDLVPLMPLADYEDKTLWYKGSDTKVYDLSAVAYYFAENLIEELNMPVGILNANLGGSSIYSWLSREAIEKDADLLADCKSEKRYYSVDKCNKNNVNHFMDMSANFNKTIAPLRNFRLSGMLWYQGESDINLSYGKYTRAFKALQDSYTELFGYDDGYLPIVFTQLASYYYEELTKLQGINMEFSDIQQQRPDSCALTSILDVSLDYLPSTHAIHPISKKEVGDKMAYAAKGLVYGLHDSYTAATVEKTEIKGNSIYVTLRDVGDKLISDGNTLNGFSICGNDGIYFSAKAEIVSDNTVKVYSSSVKSPRSVAYAYSQTNNHANLFASRNDEKLLAVSPFITERFDAHHWHNDAWATCDFAQFWHCHPNEYSGYYDTWNASDAQISFKKSEIDSGNAMYITSENSRFSVMPNYTFKEEGKDSYFYDIDLDWSDYCTLTFKIKVNSDEAIYFDGLKIKINNNLWVMPAIKDMNSTGCTIEADGNVYSITLDMSRLYPGGNIYASAFTSDILSNIFSAEFTFTDTGTSGTNICFDDVNFSSVSSSQDTLPKPDFKLSLAERIKAFFVSIYAKLVILFNKLLNK